MADSPGDGPRADPGDAPDDAQHIHRRQIEPDPDHPYFSLLHVIAELEGCEVEDLPPMYDYVDHLLEDLFTNPPPPKAQAEITFCYYDYRINVDQQGDLSVMKQPEALEIER
jgi:hypothetical protein